MATMNEGPFATAGITLPLFTVELPAIVCWLLCTENSVLFKSLFGLFFRLGNGISDGTDASMSSFSPIDSLSKSSTSDLISCSI